MHTALFFFTTGTIEVSHSLYCTGNNTAISVRRLALLKLLDTEHMELFWADKNWVCVQVSMLF